MNTLWQMIFSSDVRWFIIGATVSLIGLAAGLAIHTKRPNKKFKKELSLLFFIPMLIAFGYFTIEVFYRTFQMSSRPPISWQADYEIWACGKRVTLSKENTTKYAIALNQESMRGTSDTLVTLADVFGALGGRLSAHYVDVPTPTGHVVLQDGDSCNGTPATVNIFTYITTENYFTQFRLNDPSSYIIPHSTMPGDCVIIEFDTHKPKTDHLCNTYKMKLNQGIYHYY